MPENRLMGVVCAAGACLVLGGVAAAGPEWDESNTGQDAGSLPGNAQTPIGEGDLTLIRGRLDGLGGGGSPEGPGGDFQDMYRFIIKKPTMFTATAFSADFFPQIFLFDGDGSPLLANAPGMVSTAFMGSVSTDGTMIELTTPGEYLIAISGPPSVPVDSVGTPLFAFATPGEVSGPDGSMGIIGDWSAPDPAQFGDYEIALAFSSFVPGPGTVGLAVIPAVFAMRRRRS